MIFDLFVLNVATKHITERISQPVNSTYYIQISQKSN